MPDDSAAAFWFGFGVTALSTVFDLQPETDCFVHENFQTENQSKGSQKQHAKPLRGLRGCLFIWLEVRI